MLKSKEEADSANIVHALLYLSTEAYRLGNKTLGRILYQAYESACLGRCLDNQALEIQSFVFKFMTASPEGKKEFLELIELFENENWQPSGIVLN